MQYIITKDQRNNFLQIMRNNMQDPDAYDAIAEIESLPVLEGEAVAELLLSRSGHGIVVEWHKTVPVDCECVRTAIDSAII